MGVGPTATFGVFQLHERQVVFGNTKKNPGAPIRLDDPRIKSRPALHYRLPNCEIDEPGWGLRHLWCDWLQVEHLAGDGERLDEVCRAYLAFLDRPIGRLVEDWAEQIEPWLVDRDAL